MKKKINVGLIGYGIGGQVFHAPLLTCVDGLMLKKIRVNNPSDAALANKRYPQVELVKDSKDIINDPTIDLVIITSPNTLHFALATEALNAGKHVVVDKPFTISSKEADEVINLANEKQKVLSVYHSRRFDSDFKTVQKIIDSGLLGNIVELESRYDRFRNFLKPNAWREDDAPGSGLLYDLGSHLIDQAVTLFGLPDALTAFINRQRSGSKTDDNFELIFYYKKIKVTLKSGMLIREPVFRFLLLGNEGTFIKKGMDVQEEALKAGLTPNDINNWGVEPAAIAGIINTTANGIHFTGNVESEKGDYKSYYENIYAAITNNVPLLVTAQQARNVIRIIELAFISEREKKTIEFTQN
jgi:scyllo-inositol 2-dehydrogenase (NADP+)